MGTPLADGTMEVPQFDRDALILRSHQSGRTKYVSRISSCFVAGWRGRLRRRFSGASCRLSRRQGRGVCGTLSRRDSFESLVESKSWHIQNIS